ncbi:hypothetical protein R6Q59_009865 [Mikania micrantha]
MATLSLRRLASTSINSTTRSQACRSLYPLCCRRYQSTEPSSFRKPAWSTQLNEGSKIATKKNPFIIRHEYFATRHIGPDDKDAEQMLKALDPPAQDLEAFIDSTIPADIRQKNTIYLEDRTNPQGKVVDAAKHVSPWGKAEPLMKAHLQHLAESNVQNRSFIGCGYYGTLVPEVIKRNVLENPAWYTSYTPYQAEISQGRMESLLNFQTLVTDLTGMAIANASVLDEGTAAAEAMTMSMNSLPMSRQKRPNKRFVVSHLCHPQTISVLSSRANGFGIEIVVGDVLADDYKLVKDAGDDLLGVLAQYPDTTGGVFNFQKLADVTHKSGALFSVATDLLALTLLKPPGEFGADIAFGSAQRLGVPLGYGGPHAAFFATSDKLKRKIPGRLIGVSKDRLGNRALRLALQTREQHIRREKATSNICTAQALLANMSAMYAVYHGPDGLKGIASDIAIRTRIAQKCISEQGFEVVTQGTAEDGTVLFDTVVFKGTEQQMKDVYEQSQKLHLNLRHLGKDQVGFSVDETIAGAELAQLVTCFGVPKERLAEVIAEYHSQPIESLSIPEEFRRTSPFLTHDVFNAHHSETEILRYIHHLASKDLSLVHSMIPLGSCTMKLNASTEMAPVSLSGFSNMHPFAPTHQIDGYRRMIRTLELNLARITGMNHTTLQPNSGAQGEFAGLRVIRKYQKSKNDGKKRDICLIPVSAHGTNPASAAMAGMRVVPVKCDTKTGNLDVQDLEEKCKKHKDELAAIMVTYPSTFGVFEPEIKKVCDLVHEHGGQVYMDGANLNAQIGLCNPGDIGADVCHLNLHKTFCIPHGGGGPGVGPICVKKHLAPFLPTHPFLDPTFPSGENRASREQSAISPVSAAPFGSASILPISYSYVHMMGGYGLVHQTKMALLNANYFMSRMRPHYKILYTNANGRCAHEFILDTRHFKETCGIEAIDIAKRLQDYGFHAPTMSWPVANTLMIEPTESESKAELDRFCDALISIRNEIKDVEDGKVPRDNNVLKNAPHPQQDLLSDNWDRPYTRQQAAYPLPWLREKKFWPSVARVDDAYGDQNLFCTCSPVDGFEDLTGHQAPMPT